MRNFWRSLWLSGASLLALASCTGTFEELPPALLVVGTANELRFVEAASIQPGNDIPPYNLVAQWPIESGVVDLLKPLDRPELWVLGPSRLVVYSTAGLTATANNFPTPVVLHNLELPAPCTRGYLRGGQVNLLLVCGSEVWLVPYNQPVLNKQSTTGLPETTLYALGPEDAVLYLTDNTLSLGLVSPIQAAVDNPTNLTARDLVYEPFGGKAYALFSENFDTLSASWVPAADQKTNVQRVDLIDLGRLTAGRYGVVAYGTGGMARVDQLNLGAPGPYQLGLSGPAGFVYLAKNNLIEVFDLLTNELDQGLVNPLQVTPTALAHVLVNEAQ
jgi:hypothetical protein